MNQPIVFATNFGDNGKTRLDLPVEEFISRMRLNNHPNPSRSIQITEKHTDEMIDRQLFPEKHGIKLRPCSEMNGGN